MLHIRAEQLSALEAVGRQQFDARVRQALTDRFVAEQVVLAEQQDTELLASIWTAAESKGLEFELDYLTYLILELTKVRLGVGSEVNLDWTVDILDHVELDGRVKMTLIRTRLERLADREPRLAEALESLLEITQEVL